MEIQYVVTFNGDLPEMEQFFQKLKDCSGLDDITNNKGLLRHPAFTDHYFGVGRENKRMVLWTHSNRMWYLLEAAIGVLVSLGGESDFVVGDLAKKKWNDVKDLYQERELFSFEWPDEEEDFSKG